MADRNRAVEHKDPSKRIQPHPRYTHVTSDREDTHTHLQTRPGTACGISSIGTESHPSVSPAYDVNEKNQNNMLISNLLTAYILYHLPHTRARFLPLPLPLSLLSPLLQSISTPDFSYLYLLRPVISERTLHLAQPA